MSVMVSVMLPSVTRTVPASSSVTSLVTRPEHRSDGDALPAAPELDEVDGVGLVGKARLLVRVEVGRRLRQERGGVLAVRVLELAEHVRSAALSVRAAVELERCGVLDVVLPVVDVAERQLAAVAAGIGLDALAVAVAGGDGAVVLGARDRHQVLRVAEPAVSALLASVRADADLAGYDPAAGDGDLGLQLAATLQD
nr:hypothetical protein [Collinsella sp. AF38-3AC]